MKRWILSLGIGWALIFATNHFLLPQEPSKTKLEVSTASKPVPTERRIDSWGAYLSHPAPLREQRQGTPTPQLRSPEEAVVLPDDEEKESPEETASTSGQTKQQQSKTGARPDRFDGRLAQEQPGAPLRKAKKSVPP